MAVEASSPEEALTLALSEDEDLLWLPEPFDTEYAIEAESTVDIESEEYEYVHPISAWVNWDGTHAFSQLHTWSAKP